ncbi:helix-turn-helix transcriptional regulator [Micromonospora aurantiaca]|uniref:helix-turn-helix domain-containing protein n=1 Tax=Micromonospora aurantiaca (nom. illeg.) TaxID=47850 RepID=UPI0034232DCE
MTTRRAANGAAIKALREALGKEQAALAAEVGVGSTHLSNIEAGRRQPSPVLMGRIAAVLGVPLAAITYPVAASWPSELADEDLAAAVPAARTAAA